MDKPNVVVVARYRQEFFPWTHTHAQNLNSFSWRRWPFTDEIIRLLARGSVILFRTYPHSHVSLVRCDEEAFWKFLDHRYVDYFIVLLSASSECIFDVLLNFIAFNDEKFSISSRRHHFILIDPIMLNVVVILGDLREMGNLFECIFLQSPHLPVAVACGAHLVVIFRIEGKSLYWLVVSLLRKIEMGNNPTLNCMLAFLALLTYRLDPWIDECFHLSSAIWVVWDKDSNILRVLGES